MHRVLPEYTKALRSDWVRWGISGGERDCCCTVKEACSTRGLLCTQALAPGWFGACITLCNLARLLHGILRFWI